MEEQPNQTTPWLACCGIGCLLVVLLVGGGVYAVGYYARQGAKTVVAFGMEASAEAILAEMELSPEDQAEAMQPIRDLANRIRAGEVSFKQGEAVFNSLVSDGALEAVVAVLLTKGFERRYLDASGLSPEEKASARLNISRYQHGVLSEAIPKEGRRYDELSQLVTVTKTQSLPDGSQRVRKEFKKSLTDEELRRCVKIMKEVADEKGIAEIEIQVDVASKIQAAIDKGMAKGSGR